jgi:hypothetical protein
LQQSLSGISKYYHELNFSANALPGTAFPPYNDLNNSLAQQEVSNRNILQWSVWLDGFNYTLAEKYQDFNHSYLYMQPEPQGKLFISGAEKNPTSFDQGTLDLLNAGKSGLQIAAVGIGGIRPIPPNANLTAIQQLPAPMPVFLNLTESILAIMMDMAGKDLDGRVLGTGYLCTITKTPWKKAIPMLAMIIGSCSGMFGAALTIMLFVCSDIWFDCFRTKKIRNVSLISLSPWGGLFFLNKVARRYDSHLISKQQKRETLAESAVSDNRLMQSERDELMLESQLEATTKQKNKENSEKW